MEPLNIKETLQTPEIHLNGNKGLFRISGKSYPENAHAFYKPVLAYIAIYCSIPQSRTILEFSWLYYNTSTAQVIARLIRKLKNCDSELQIKWHCKIDNELIIRNGEEIREILDVRLDILPL